MENFDEAIKKNKWLLKVIEDWATGEFKQYAIDRVIETIEFLKWAEERILELEKE